MSDSSLCFSNILLGIKPLRFVSAISFVSGKILKFSSNYDDINIRDKKKRYLQVS